IFCNATNPSLFTFCKTALMGCCCITCPTTSPKIKTSAIVPMIFFINFVPTFFEFAVEVLGLDLAYCSQMDNKFALIQTGQPKQHETPNQYTLTKCILAETPAQTR